MTGQKLTDMKGAATDLIDIVVSDDQSRSTSRVGIAPFAHTVKVSDAIFDGSTGKKKKGATFSGCVAERSGVDKVSDKNPKNDLFPLEDVAPPGTPCIAAEVVPLTDQKADLKASISSLTAAGMTAGHLGTAWAWYLMSPHWKHMFDRKSEPGKYSDLDDKLSNGDPKLRKIAVLMTDGDYNVSYTGGDATAQARELCTQMKKVGITVYTVGFDLGGSATATDTLKECASDASKFYNATTGDALRAAFRDIGLKAAPLRLTK